MCDYHPQTQRLNNVFLWGPILWVDWAQLGSYHMGPHVMGWAGSHPRGGHLPSVPGPSGSLALSGQCLQGPPHDLGLSQHGRFRIVALFTWQLAPRTQKVEATGPGRAARWTDGAIFPCSIGQRSHGPTQIQEGVRQNSLLHGGEQGHVVQEPGRWGWRGGHP